MDEWLRRGLDWLRQAPILAGIFAGALLVGFPLVHVLMAADVPRMGAVLDAGLVGACAAVGTVWLLSTLPGR